MDLSNRKQKILVELLKHDDYITGSYLAKILSVTTRTVRSEIASLNNELSTHNCSISSTQGKGYKLSIDIKKSVKSLIRDTVAYKIPILPSQRVNYIIKQLLLYPKGIIITKISDALYVSESTLKRDISKVNSYLNDYNLSLDKNSKNEFYISGNEVKIRNLYIQYFSQNTVDSVMTGDLNQKRIQSKTIIKNILEDNYVPLSGNEFNRIAMFLAIQLFRIEKNYILDKHNETDVVEDLINFYFSELGKTLDINKYEEEYLLYFLHDFFGDLGSVEVTADIIRKTITEVETFFEYKATPDIQKRITSLFKRKKHFNLNEFSITDVKTDFPYAFEIGTTFIQLLSSTYHIEVLDELFLQVMLEFVNDVEKVSLEKELKTVHVVLVTDSGTVSSKLIQLRLKRYFSHILVQDSFAPYEKEKIETLQPDMIITTIPFSINDIPVIMVNPLLKDYDIVKISTAIRKLENPDTINYEFSNLFQEELFIKELECESPFEAIKSLHELMVQKGMVNNLFLQNVLERENISSTAVGNLVAIPHSIGPNIKGNSVGVAILKKPINWADEKVQIVFLMNIGNSKEAKVKQIFDSFFELVSNDKKVRTLIKSNNYYEFIKNITQ